MIASDCVLTAEGHMAGSEVVLGEVVTSPRQRDPRP